MTLLPLTRSSTRNRSRYALREAVLAAFTSTADAIVESLGRVPEKEWQAQLRWLDTSGMALYLLDHLMALQLEGILPPRILVRLQQNLIDNRDRTSALLAEAVEINRGFQREGVQYVNLKGITLYPDSVPDPALRCQLDLDFKIFAGHAPAAAVVLKSMGYSLYCVSGTTWEFKAGSSKLASIEDLYKVKPQRSAELHLVPGGGLFEEVDVRCFLDTPFPVLRPVDLYVAQMRHLFKHICSPSVRAAWVLEARRNMMTHRADESFWCGLRKALSSDPQGALACGIVALLVAEVFGDMPEALVNTSAERVEPAVRLWIRHYGRQALLASFPGTKYYLLLLAALPHGGAATGSQMRQHLLPLRRPPMIIRGYAGEPFLCRMKRYRIQLTFVLFRLRFHGVHGAGYILESLRFRRLLTGLDH